MGSWLSYLSFNKGNGGQIIIYSSIIISEKAFDGSTYKK